MKKTIIILASIALIILIGIGACQTKDKYSDYTPPSEVGVTEVVKEEKQSPVKRGEYLVSIMGCDDCHTPKILTPKGPEFDMGKRFSGHPAKMPIGKYSPEQLKSWVLFNPTATAFVGQWGVSFAANITSDDTGIGTWSEEQFLTAIRMGKYKGLPNSRDLLPPMPWPVYKNATDEDLKAIYAYLKTTKPVENIVPPSIAPQQLAMN